MKRISTFAAAVMMSAAMSFAADEASGIYLSGTMNDWAENDPAWELKFETETPGWVAIDLTSMPAGTQFRVVGYGRSYGMKNDRNTIRQNSEHLMTLDGANNLVACEESLDGVYFMVQSEGFLTDKYLGVLTVTSESEVLYGACMESSVTPTLLEADESSSEIVAAEVNITEPFYIVKAYKLSNATQTVNNYGLSSTDGVLVPTSNLSPTVSAIPVPEDGEGSYMVRFNVANYAYSVGDDNSVESVGVSGAMKGDVYYNLQGIRVSAPVSGGVYILVREGKALKISL